MKLNKVSLGNLTWIDIVRPTDQEIKYLGEYYN